MWYRLSVRPPVFVAGGLVFLLWMFRAHNAGRTCPTGSLRPFGLFRSALMCGQGALAATAARRGVDFGSGCAP